MNTVNTDIAPRCPLCSAEKTWSGFAWVCVCKLNSQPVPNHQTLPGRTGGRIPSTHDLPQMPSIQMLNMKRIEALLERIVELLEKQNEK